MERSAAGRTALSARGLSQPLINDDKSSTRGVGDRNPWPIIDYCIRNA